MSRERTTPAERLLALVASRIPVPPGTEIRRTYAGRLQREAGAWSWFALSPAGKVVCGSHYPVAELLRAAGIHVSRSVAGDIDIDPVRNLDGPAPT